MTPLKSKTPAKGKPLTAPEERELIAAAKRGSRRALDRLVVAFQPFVRQAASRAAYKYGLEADDLAQEGLILIPDTIDRFDLNRGVRFSTFLRHRLRGEFTKHHRIAKRTTGVADISKLDKIKRAPILTGKAAKPGIPIHHPVAMFWPDEAIRYVRCLRRANDREIAKSLWLIFPARRPVEIARSLCISRSAVCQRQKYLMAELTRRFGNITFDQYVVRPLLNDFWTAARCWDDDD